MEVPGTPDEARARVHCAEGLLRMPSEGDVVIGTVFRRNHCLQWCICGRNTSGFSCRRRLQITALEVPGTPDEARTSAHCAEGPLRMPSEGDVVFGAVSRRNHCL